MNKAVKILEKIVYLQIPVFLRFEIFDYNMRCLLSNYKLWLETWNSVSPSINKLFKIFQASTQFKDFNRRFNILKTVIFSLTIIVAALGFYTLIALLTLPVMLLLSALIYYLRAILAEKYLVESNKKSIERVVKPKRRAIIKLINFLKSL